MFTNALSAAGAASGVGILVNVPTIIDKDEFFEKFRDAKIIATDDAIFSDKESISSFEIGDCITVFGMNKKNGTITNIFGYHFASDSGKKEIKDEIDSYLKNDGSCEMYIIGGNGSKDSEKCLKKTRTVINELRNDNSFTITVLGEFTNLNADKKYTYISANLQMDGTFTYCKHDLT